MTDSKSKSGKKSKSPKLSIIILNYNTRDLLVQTLNSIKTKIPHEILVADNGSKDDSVKVVKKKFPKVTVVENNENIGFAAGNNRALKKAKGEYLMLLNSDTEIKNKALKILVDYLDNHSDVGVVSPKLRLANGKLDGGCHRGFPTLWSSFTYFSGLQKLFPHSQLFGQYHQTWKNLEKIHEVDVVSGAAMVFRREILDQVGYLDEDYFMYAEDIDYCKRIKNHGWKIIYNPKAIVVHHKGQSGTYHIDHTVRSKTRKYFYDTMKLYFRKHHGNQYPGWVLWSLDKMIDVVAIIRG